MKSFAGIVCEGKWFACGLGVIKWIDILELHVPSSDFVQVPTTLCSNACTADCPWFVDFCCFSYNL